MIELSYQFETDPGAEFVIPQGLATPHTAPTGLTLNGAHMTRLAGEPQLGQMLACCRADASEVTVRLTFAAEGGACYPEQMFSVQDSRFTRSAAQLVGESREIAARAGGGEAGLCATVQHVAGLFDYGHPEQRFYDNHTEIPQLCGMTQGSCVDINAYLIAALRGAGYEAGYIYGVFVPEEKRTWAEDGHCWVVSRYAGQCLEWDIAHFLKMGRAEIQPGLNPKPGVRLPMSHSMGWNIPALGWQDIKLVGGPCMIDAGDTQAPYGQGEPRALRIALAGYEALAG